MRVIGTPLVDLALQTYTAVPPFLEQCFSFLISNNRLATEGIFRQQGNEVEIRKYQAQIDKTGSVEFPDDCSPHLVANIITRFIRDIPGHILQDKNSEAWEFVKTAESAKSLVNDLPFINKALLSRLIGFFKIVARHVETTRMELGSLGTILSPILIANPKSPQFYLNPGICAMMIEKYDVIFDSVKATKDNGFIPAEDFRDMIADRCNEFFCKYRLNEFAEAKQTKLSRNFEISDVDVDDLLTNLLRIDSKSANTVSLRHSEGLTPL